MRLSKNEVLVYVSTIHQLSVENLVCPKFSTSQEELESRIFNIVKADDNFKLLVNRSNLNKFILKVSKSNKVELDEFSVDILGDYVSKTVSSDFMTFLKVRGLSLEDLVLDNSTIH